MKYRGKTLNIDHKLLELHKSLYGESFPEWRADNYIHQELRSSEKIEKIISDMSDREIEKIITNGLRAEIKANSIKGEDIACATKNPSLNIKKENG